MRLEGEFAVTSRQRMLFWRTCDDDGPRLEIIASVRAFHHQDEVLLDPGTRSIKVSQGLPLSAMNTHSERATFRGSSFCSISLLSVCLFSICPSLLFPLSSFESAGGFWSGVEWLSDGVA